MRYEDVLRTQENIRTGTGTGPISAPVQHILDGAGSGEPFFIGDVVLDLLQIGARTLPGATTLTFVFPAHTGCAVFDGRVEVTEREMTRRIVGFCWNVGTWTELPDADGHPSDHPSLLLTPIWERDEENWEIPNRFAGWFFGAPVADPCPGYPQDSAIGDLMRRLFAAFSLFSEQRITVLEKGHLDRAAVRRLTREHIEPRTIRIVYLRRMRRSGTGTRTEQEREWQCRWVVSGHWRNQWYPLLATHKPHWITPYVKGPPDKPLRGGERVFAVVR